MGANRRILNKAIARLRNAFGDSFQSKILIFCLGGVLSSILLSAVVFLFGMDQLVQDTFAEIERSLGETSQKHLERQIKGTSERINLWLGQEMEHFSTNIAIGTYNNILFFEQTFH